MYIKITKYLLPVYIYYNVFELYFKIENMYLKINKNQRFFKIFKILLNMFLWKWIWWFFSRWCGYVNEYKWCNTGDRVRISSDTEWSLVQISSINCTCIFGSHRKCWKCFHDKCCHDWRLFTPERYNFYYFRFEECF